MRLIQARVTDAEYALLQSNTCQAGKPMQELVREALRAHLVPHTVDPEDPISRAFPLFRSKDGQRVRASKRHDEILYEESR